MTARLVALIVLMAGAGTAAGAEFGRMFFTPEQRAALDHFRKLNIRSATIGDDDRDKDLVPPPPELEQVSVSGIVRRSDGKSTVWVNRRAVTEQQPADAALNVTPRTDNRVRLNVPKSGRSADLKVGQTIDVLSGAIEEGYARRAAVKPGPADKPAATSATTPKPQAATPPPRRTRDLQDQNEPGLPAQAEAGPAK